MEKRPRPDWDPEPGWAPGVAGTAQTPPAPLPGKQQLVCSGQSALAKLTGDIRSDSHPDPGSPTHWDQLGARAKGTLLPAQLVAGLCYPITTGTLVEGTGQGEQLAPSQLESPRVTGPAACWSPYFSVSSQGRSQEPKLTQREWNSDGQRNHCPLPSWHATSVPPTETRWRSLAFPGTRKAGVQDRAHTGLSL